MINLILELSTAHIRPTTDQLITNSIKKQDVHLLGIAAYPEDRGYFIWIPPFEKREDLPYIPLDLFNVLDFAKRLNCKWVLFDGDAPEMTPLPTYDWK